MIDRRVQRTLRALHEALIALIQERGYDAVTVKEIINRANVGRSTFYAHYTDKEHLLQSGLDDFGKVLLAQQRSDALTGKDTVGLAFSRAVFEHAHGYRTVYRGMLGEHAGLVVANRMRKVLSRLVRDDLATRRTLERVKEVPREAMIEYVVAAIMSLLTWWVDAPDEYSIDELDAIFRRLLPPGLV